MPTVNMPNGDAVNFPDDMPKEQIRSLISQKFPDVAKAAQPPQAPQEQGFLDRVGADIGKRAQMAQDIKGRAGAQPIGETALQAVGGVGAGLMNDVVGEAAKSAYGMLPDAVKSKIESNPVVKMGVSMAQKGAETYNKWAQQNPRAARDVEATVNIASLFPLAKPVSKVAETAAAPVTGIVKGAVAPGAALKGATGATYRESNVAANAEKMAQFNKIESAKRSAVKITPDALKSIDTAIGKVVDVSDEVKKADAPLTLKAIQNLQANIASGKVSLENIVSTRNKLSEAQWTGGAEAQYAKSAKDALDAELKSVIDKKAASSGDVADIKAWQDATKEYGKAKQYEEIVNKINEGEGKTNRMRAKIKDLIDDTVKFAAYPKGVQAALIKMEKGRGTTNTLAVTQELIDSLPLGFGKFGHMLTSKVIGKSADALNRRAMNKGFKTIKRSIQTGE